MMPFETSCMPLLGRMSTLYGKNSGMPLRQEFHYKLIFIWPERTRSSLLMWWLLIQHGRWWFWMSLVDQHVQLRNLAPLLRFANKKGFRKGTILFWWPWRCTVHPGMIWIVSLGNVFIFSMIDDWGVIYLHLFTFNFLGSVLVLFSNMF